MALVRVGVLGGGCPGHAGDGGGGGVGAGLKARRLLEVGSYANQPDAHVPIRPASWEIHIERTGLCLYAGSRRSRLPWHPPGPFGLAVHRPQEMRRRRLSSQLAFSIQPKFSQSRGLQPLTLMSNTFKRLGNSREIWRPLRDSNPRPQDLLSCILSC
jgi:hypothetical protein